MAIHVIQSQRIDVLLQAMQKTVFKPAKNAFQVLQAQHFIVPSPAVEAWLTQKLAEQQGISANTQFHHRIRGFQWSAYQWVLVDQKDEVRKAGLELGIPERLVFRQPFPGPGLGIRIIGEVTAEKVRIVQDADFIYREEVDNAAAEYKKEHGEDPSWMPNQYFAALTNMRSVGVMGDFRTYDYAVALRAVKTIDFMTAESAEIPYAVLNKVMNRIINEVKGVNRVFYDLTSKPPGTIEFE